MPSSPSGSGWAPSKPARLNRDYSEDDAEGTRNSNRFTLTDYVYDREDFSSVHSFNAVASSSRTVTAERPPLPTLRSASRLELPLPPGAAPGSGADGRPSSWGLAVQGQIAQVRGSTIPTTSSPRSPSSDRTQAETTTITYPPPLAISSSSSSGMMASSRTALLKSSRFPEAFVPDISTSPRASTSGPQLSPSENVAIKRLPPIPTPTSPPPSSGNTSTPRPALPASTSSLSIASSIPSPLLPPFQLNQPRLGASRPSLASMPSSSSTSGLKREREQWSVSPELPKLGYDPRNTSVTFVPLDEREKRAGAEAEGEGKREEEGEGDVEKGASTLRYKESRPERTSKKGRWWDWIIPDTLYTRLLLGTVVFELIIDLVIEANILWRFNTEVKSASSTPSMLENKRRLPIFLIIFGLAHLWQLVLTIIAIRTKNTIQISAITIFNYAFLVWAIIQVSELRTILGDLQTSLIDDAVEAATPGVSKTTSLLNLPLNVLTAVIIGVVAVCCLVLTVLAYFVRREFGYRFLGADLQIRGYYRRFQVFECFVYFSAFFTAGFGIQFLWLVLQKTDAEYIITFIMFPLSLILLVIGRTAAKYENKPFMIFFCTGLTLGQAYFIFKLCRIWQQDLTVYANVSKTLTVFAGLSILSLLACLAWSVLVYRDFGKGLKGAVLSQYPRSPRTQVGFNRWKSDPDAGGAAAAAAAKRLSID